MVPGGGGDGTADLRGGGRGGGGTTGDWLRDSGTADLGGGRRGGGGSLLHTCAWRTGLCNDLVSRKFRWLLSFSNLCIRGSLHISPAAEISNREAEW
ncbi:uncharacterized protein LOC125324980 isoform X8 [Corvus hawaiiensis]|uniref:uncharacterized protein LOC125324980 isoform X8 n=1 Tax=Corvus hawaiiensis TaxID=134902 RepID=UPI00201A206A|nr:uncharacterized protein LOC125324980 isoform X8 [Corvus hawaiiensis]